MPGEKEHVIKLPGFFEKAFVANPQLSEDVGEQLAKWAVGTSTIVKQASPALIAEYAACSEPSEFRRLEEVRKASWPSYSKEEKSSAKAASDIAAKRIEEAAKAPVSEPVMDDEDFVENKAAS
jgi:hypothetical protein